MMMESWTSYPKIYNLGHAAVLDITKEPVYVEEKIDGSQISFGVDAEGGLHIKSRSANIVPDAPEKMFAAGVTQIQEVRPLLHPGWTYRGEYLAKPKHNTLAYERVPKRHIMIFDIATGQEQYLADPGREREAERLGFECVLVLWKGLVKSVGQLTEFLGCTGVLGGQLVEGVVLKPVGYGMFGKDGKPLMAKYVSEKFKEKHGVEWKTTNPSKLDVVRGLVDSLKTDARWEKAIQWLRDQGGLQGAPQDIGPLIKRIQGDVLEEESESIKDALAAWAIPQIRRGIVRGFPEWYKARLAGQQFAEKDGEGKEPKP